MYPQSLQLLLLAVKPSNTLLPISFQYFPLEAYWDDEAGEEGDEAGEGDERAAPSPRSRRPSLSTAAVSDLIHSEMSWKSSWASWCWREEKRRDCFEREWSARACIMSRGRIALGEDLGWLSAEE